MQSAYAQFLERGTEVLALAVQDLAGAQSMDAAVQAEFPILSDADHAVADSFGVFNLLGDGIAAPAVFVIDPSGQIIWSYVGKDAADRPSLSEILSHLP